MNKYRVIVHAHSTWSYDGSFRIRELASLFSRYRAHVLMLTEHSQGFDAGRIQDFIRECELASSTHFRVVPGIEYSSPGNHIHILTWGLDSFLKDELEVMEILEAVNHYKGFAVFAHPNRRDAWRSFSEDWVPLLHGVELWNRKTDGVCPSPEAIRILEMHELKAFAAIDFHRLNQLYPIYNEISSHDKLADMSNDQVISLLRDGRVVPKFLGMPVWNEEHRRPSRSIHGLEVLKLAYQPVRYVRKRLRERKKQSVSL